MRACSRNFRLARSLAVTLSLAGPAIASAQTADTILFNGKILTVDKAFSVQQALAIGHGRIVATGTSAAMKKLATGNARLIDLGGRTVIPGLTDGHIHGIRAALTFGTEVNWIGVPTLKDALEKIRQAAKAQKPGSWIVVAGGWTEEQFAEKRRPTPGEVAALAPDNPVYIQHLYDWLLLTLALLHDLAEAKTGDIDAVKLIKEVSLAERKVVDEEKAMRELTEDLPFGDWIYSIWKEYEDQETIEAKFVKALDKIEGFLHIAEVGVEAYMPKEFHAEYANEAVQAFDEATHHFPELEDLLDAVKNELREKFEQVGVKWIDGQMTPTA